MSFSNNNENQGVTAKMQDAASSAYDTSAGYMKQASENVSAGINNAREYVSETVAPTTNAEKVEEGTKDTAKNVDSMATDVADKVDSSIHEASTGGSSFEEAKSHVATGTLTTHVHEQPTTNKQANTLAPQQHEKK